jgi:protein ImuB
MLVTLFPRPTITAQNREKASGFDVRSIAGFASTEVERSPSADYANMCSVVSPIVICVLIPRLELTVAAGNRTDLLGVPAALAPEPGASQQVGEVSLAAEAFGIHPGMRLGEALARCPRLMLIPPDPAGVSDRWEQVLSALESIGAAVEPGGPGLACFDARGLLRLLGGQPAGVLEAARRVIGGPARFGVAPARFAAVAAASQARVRRPVHVGGGERHAREFLAPLPVSLLRLAAAPASSSLRVPHRISSGQDRTALTKLPEALERMGIRTLGELAALPVAAIADRFGRTGELARRLACGRDTPLHPRSPGEFIREALDLPEASSGLQLERALGLLIDRLLARPERRGRTLRSVVLSAVLVEQGGTWQERIIFREALSDSVRMRLALVPKLSQLPAPAGSLRLAVERFGPATGDQRGLLDDPEAERSTRLREAIGQARAAAGPDAAMRILPVDPGSRFPERRAVLTPSER